MNAIPYYSPVILRIRSGFYLIRMDFLILAIHGIVPVFSKGDDNEVLSVINNKKLSQYNRWLKPLFSRLRNYPIYNRSLPTYDYCINNHRWERYYG